MLCRCNDSPVSSLVGHAKKHKSDCYQKLSSMRGSSKIFQMGSNFLLS